MKFYVSTKGIKRVGNGSPKNTATAAAAAAATGRRISNRTVIPAVVVLGILSIFAFLRVAVLALDSSFICSSFDCLGWRFFSNGDTTMKLRAELIRALMEANDGNVNERGADTFNELVNVMASKQDLKAFAFNTKAMFLQMERKVQSAKKQESVSWHLASHGFPKGLHCLSLKLAEEYAVNAMARSRLPPPEYASRLVDPTFHHLVLFTDNVLAASVVVASTVENSANPEKLVFHIVTDKKTYTAMHAWFSINTIKSAVVEVRGLHHYDWSEEANAGVKEMLETNHLIWKHYYNNYIENDLHDGEELNRYLEALGPSTLSLLNHLRIYLPELFPDLNKVVFLDDDVVVQHDISSLWELDLNGKVSGSVFKSWCEDGCCYGNKYANFLNFSHPFISSNFVSDLCAWTYGMNVFDLQAWRRTNITETYHHWLRLNVKSGLGLWYPGVLPPALIAFEGQVHPIDSSWLVTDLGYRHQYEEISIERLEAAAVVHFNGPAKPWLEIGIPKVRNLWIRYVNFSDKFVRRCRVIA
ncbi:PREDICTED: probable galacturonosyltransferase 15 isoform X1 [Lupinus angustifolius]|uniref:probable galacturonosyltransferase 15 isoform X1 n=1 Tax=Lupinus angustifolius TaxID=3871 RepID=UPI00092F01AE|nr:PREDICTED: probable galacturonosyltransferase 15 isoform X1 [Lupinus angustifolius]